jgi:predicted RNA binding protein YcfA (HicA-like mRNA interferase family)
MKVREVIKLIEVDGWIHVQTHGAIGSSNIR